MLGVRLENQGIGDSPSLSVLNLNLGREAAFPNKNLL
jgi:hypothetical protein